MSSICAYIYIRSGYKINLSYNEMLFSSFYSYLITQVFPRIRGQSLPLKHIKYLHIIIFWFVYVTSQNCWMNREEMLTAQFCIHELTHTFDCLISFSSIVEGQAILSTQWHNKYWVLLCQIIWCSCFQYMCTIYWDIYDKHSLHIDSKLVLGIVED